MSAEFEQAVKDVNALTTKPSDDDLLRLYGLFKTVTVGKNTTSRPGMFDLKGKAKWDAWTQASETEGLSKEQAEAKYIELAKKLVG